MMTCARKSKIKALLPTLTVALLALLLFACGHSAPSVRMSFEVVDDSGKPLAGVQVKVSTFDHWEPGEGFGRDVSKIFTGFTDAGGRVTIEAAGSRPEFRYGVQEPPGFYRGGGGAIHFDGAKNGKWTPQEPHRKITLMRILNPIPMYARWIGGLRALPIPAIGQPVGFDLIASDWVAPYGKGQQKDLIFTLNRNGVSSAADFTANLKVEFAHEGDGIQSVDTSGPPSELKVLHQAPSDGYLPSVVHEKARNQARELFTSTVRPERNYFFRVRTVLDEKKHLVSAMYGKIYGDIDFWPAGDLRFIYYINPNANDRNTEFDRHRNLFKNLDPLEAPTDP